VARSAGLAQVERLAGTDTDTDRDNNPAAPHPLLRADPALGVRLGLASVRGIGEGVAKRIAQAREQSPFASLGDLARRAKLTPKQMEALATAGALASLEPDRRAALWAAGAAVETEAMLPGTAIGTRPPPLAPMTPVERSASDVWATGVSVDCHPMVHQRPAIQAAGVAAITEALASRPGAWLRVAGVVTHRQRPSTAGGIVFLSLEDETGLLNVVCKPDVWAAYRARGRRSPALVVTGRLERADGVANLLAARLENLAIPFATKARDFH
jgi:error-prone DNA polymerase